MKPLELCLFSALSLLCYGASLAEHGFRPRQEYIFLLEGRTVAGFPDLGQSQHAGAHYRGTIKVQRDSPNSILLKVHNISYIKIHENLPEGWWSEVQYPPEMYKELHISSSTVSVKLGHHNVESVAVKKGLQRWEINFIQGIAYQLYVTDPAGTTSKPKNSQTTTSYTIKENSLFGRCETSFEITKVPRAIALAHTHLFPNADICGSRNFYEIFKTRNFSNCQSNPEFHFGLPKSMRCPPGGNECEDVWNRASVTRLSGCGERSDFEILQSETNTRVIANLHLHNRTQASVSSYLALNLKTVKPINHKFTPPTDPEVYLDLKFQHIPFKDTTGEGILYDSSSDEENIDFDGITTKTTEKSKIKPKKTINSNIRKLRSLPQPVKTGTNKMSALPHFNMESPPVQPLSPMFFEIRENDASFNRIQKLRELITDASNELEVPKSIPVRMTMEKVVTAVNLCRTMTYMDLSKTAAIISLQAQNNRMLLTERMLLRDVLVMCGTGPSFRILRGWLENRDLSGEEASGVVASMPSHFQAPDSETVNEFYTLVRLLSTREDQQLKTTAILALSNLLRIACVQSEELEARYFTLTFHGRCKPEDMVYYMSWFMSESKTDSSLRRVFLTALGNTGNVTALAYLRTVAQDQSMSAYIRTTAVYSMKYQVLNNPKEASQVLFSLYRDTGIPVPVRIAAVSLLFYTKPSLATLQRIAVSTWYDPIPAVVAFVRSSFQSLSKVEDPIYQKLARYAGMALPLSRPLSLGLHKPYNLLWSRVTREMQEVVLAELSYDTSLEASNLYFRYTQRLGGISRNVIEAEFTAANLNMFFTKLREMIYPSDDVSMYRPAIQDFPRSTRWIRETLNIAQRNLPKFEGDFHIILDKLHERMFPMDKKTFVDIAKGGRKLIENLEDGHIFNYQKIDLRSVSIHVITELGFPVNFNIHVPWALRITTDGRINTEEKTLDMSVAGVYASQLITEIAFYTGWDKTVHTAASHGVTLVNFPPVKMNAKLDTEKRSLDLNMEAIEPEAESILLHHSVKPFTSQHDVFSFNNIKSTMSVIRNTRSTQKSISILPNINLNYTTGMSNDSPFTWIKNAISVNGFCTISPNLDANSIEVKMDKFNAMNFQFTLDRATIINNKRIIPSSTEKQLNRSEESTTPFSTTVISNTTTSKVTAATPITTTNPTTSTSTNQEKILKLAFEEVNVSNAEDVFENLLIKASNVTTTTIKTTKPTVTTDTTTQATTTTMGSTTEAIDPTKRHTGGFNASYIEPFITSHRETQADYILGEMLSGISNGRAYLFGFHAHSDSEHSYDIYWSQAFSRSQKEQRYGAFYQKIQPQRKITQLKLTSKFETPVSPVFTLEDAIKSNVSASLNSDLVYSFDNKDYKFNIKVSMGRNPEKREPLSDIECLVPYRTAESDISPHCLQRAVEAMYLDRYNVTLIYNDEAKELAPKALQSFKYIRYWLMPYITDDNEYLRYYSTPANTIKSVLTLSPQQDVLDFWIRSQSMETEFRNIPVNTIARNLLRFHPGISRLRLLKGESYCANAEDKWITFDGLQYEYNLTTSNWHVLVKDCSGRSRIVILVRMINNIKELEVNLDNYKVLTLRPGLDISVNESPVKFDEDVAEIRDEADTLIMVINRNIKSGSIVTVEIPDHGFNLLYTGSSFIVMVQDNTRNRLCGLCGDNNGDIANDLANPRGTLEKEAETFVESYSLPEENFVAENR